MLARWPIIPKPPLRIINSLYHFYPVGAICNVKYTYITYEGRNHE